MSSNSSDPKALAPVLRFIADEMESGRYQFSSIDQWATLAQLFPSEEIDPDDDVETGFTFTNNNGVITLLLRIEQ